jgi:hypothetical protein
MNRSPAITKRWSLINKNTGHRRVSRTTRDAARISKRSNERIYDNLREIYVR